jgi:hypothetical protein
MRYTVLASVLACAAFAVGLDGHEQQAPKPTLVTGEGGARFEYSSTLEPVAGGSKVHNVIVNRHTTNYLAVRWDDGRIAAVGAQQLGPGQRAVGRDLVVQNPALVHNSAIRYGAGLQYVRAADVHVEPLPRDRADLPKELGLTFITTVAREDSDGKDLSHMTITSRLNDDRAGAELSIDIPRGWSVLVPRAAIASIYFASLSGTASRWKSSEQSIDSLFSDPDLRRAARAWLRAASPLTLLENPDNDGSQSAHMVGRVTGTTWDTVNVPLLAFPPKRDGYLGAWAKLHRIRPPELVAN